MPVCHTFTREAMLGGSIGRGFWMLLANSGDRVVNFDTAPLDCGAAIEATPRQKVNSHLCIAARYGGSRYGTARNKLYVNVSNYKINICALLFELRRALKATRV